jgi:hypothetical protein
LDFEAFAAKKSPQKDSRRGLGSLKIGFFKTWGLKIGPQKGHFTGQKEAKTEKPFNFNRLARNAALKMVQKLGFPLRNTINFSRLMDR